MENNISHGEQEENEEVVENPLWRKGKWSAEEEAYAQKLIFAFRIGYLNLLKKDGRTLRSFLSKKLNCNPMRISKKFAGLEGLGGRFVPREGVSQDQIECCQAELKDLESKFVAKDEDMIKRRRKRRRRVVDRSSSLNSNYSSSFTDVSDGGQLDEFDENSALDFFCDFDDQASKEFCGLAPQILIDSDSVSQTSEIWSTASESDSDTDGCHAVIDDALFSTVKRMLTVDSFDSYDFGTLDLDDSLQ